MKRREFMRQMGLGSLALAPVSLSALIKNEGVATDVTRFENPEDEQTWNKLIPYFKKPTDFIQFEHGYFLQAPSMAWEAYQQQGSYIQQFSSYYMRRELEQDWEETRKKAADFLGLKAEHLALTRNTTESLNQVIMGYPWQKGDEVIIGDQDYGSMTEAFEQASARFGVVVKVAKIPLNPHDDQELVMPYLSLLTKKTKMVHLTHLINLTGQLIPLTAIISAIRAANKEVFIAVDAAHSLAHVAINWLEVDAEAIGASFHKWTFSPLGMGLLYLNERAKQQLWPLMGDSGYAKSDIRRFEHLGTRPAQSFKGLSGAIDFHQTFGGVANKEKRLRYLHKLLRKELEAENLIWNSPSQECRYVAICNIQIKSLTPARFAELLFEHYRIFSVAIQHPKVMGVRFTPHIYTSADDVRELASAIKDLNASLR